MKPKPLISPDKDCGASQVLVVNVRDDGDTDALETPKPPNCEAPDALRFTVTEDVGCRLSFAVADQSFRELLAYSLGILE